MEDPPNLTHIESGPTYCGNCKWVIPSRDWCKRYRLGVFYHDLCDSWESQV